MCVNGSWNESKIEKKSLPHKRRKNCEYYCPYGTTLYSGMNHSDFLPFISSISLIFLSVIFFQLTICPSTPNSNFFSLKNNKNEKILIPMSCAGHIYECVLGSKTCHPFNREIFFFFLLYIYNHQYSCKFFNRLRCFEKKEKFYVKKNLCELLFSDKKTSRKKVPLGRIRPFLFCM